MGLLADQTRGARPQWCQRQPRQRGGDTYGTQAAQEGTSESTMVPRLQLATATRRHKWGSWAGGQRTTLDAYAQMGGQSQEHGAVTDRVGTTSVELWRSHKMCGNTRIPARWELTFRGRNIAQKNTKITDVKASTAASPEGV